MGIAGVLGCLWWLASPQRETLATLEWKSLTQVPVPARIDRETPGQYVGSPSCRECHPGETAAFARSGHARTLNPAGSGPIARWLDGKTVEDPELPGVSWSYHLQSGALRVDRSEKGKTETVPINFGFGSAHTGITFVTAMNSGPEAPAVGIEHRLSYLTVSGKLGLTPGQHDGSIVDPGTRIVPFGRFLDESHLQKCFDCHATTTSRQDRQRLEIDTMIPNVTCERCHGPGGEHIDAARRRASESEFAMPLGLDRASPEDQMTACGECHRSPTQVAVESIEERNVQFVRFQPVGLAKSKCFADGKSGLSCTSCHDPHARLSRNTPLYEAVCLTCHEPSGAATKPCTVSPRKDCVGCHMPRRGVTPEFMFTDHWIRVVGRDETRAAPR
jgi:hypothetical protein